MSNLLKTQASNRKKDMIIPENPDYMDWEAVEERKYKKFKIVC